MLIICFSFSLSLKLTLPETVVPHKKIRRAPNFFACFVVQRSQEEPDTEAMGRLVGTSPVAVTSMIRARP
jgi:hypothetical protein